MKSHIIKSTTPCKFCGQLGFTKNLPYKVTKAFKEEQRRIDAMKNPNNHQPKEPRTPSLSGSIGEQLKEQLALKAEQQAAQ